MKCLKRKFMNVGEDLFRRIEIYGDIKSNRLAEVRTSVCLRKLVATVEVEL